MYDNFNSVFLTNNITSGFGDHAVNQYDDKTQCRWLVESYSFCRVEVLKNNALTPKINFLKTVYYNNCKLLFYQLRDDNNSKETVNNLNVSRFYS